MARRILPKPRPEASEDVSFMFKWGKFVTRVTAITATVAGTLAAFFSSSSVTSGVALTAVGAGTLAAAEKLPDSRYLKTKHVPPLRTGSLGKATLPPDILSRPEKIVDTKTQSTQQARTVGRSVASYERFKD